MKIKVLLQVGKQSSTTHLGRGWWGAQGRAAAWWMNKADGEEREACSGRGGVFILQTGFIWVVHVCITHKIYVSLEVMLEGGRGVMGPEMSGSWFFQVIYIKPCRMCLIFSLKSSVLNNLCSKQTTPEWHCPIW